ncbi:winged helix-turn-helix transcriptional regulator [Bradyrhizobium sp. AZCC 2289]|uniref:winged helix-turn-helix transcriptional regulator n=1 Tax=Bradyrhizobium sp. AZCC 2289 TaxID=3117026 RepID=UPI002FF38E48
MPNAGTNDDGDTRVVLDLLESIERDGAQTQRRLAQNAGVAVGLVNAYLKRCVNKGFVKVRQAPARRFAYYLTPKGFAEKSRLTVSYLSASLSFFRIAKTDCTGLFKEARRNGFTRLALVGQSDLAEICIICGIDCGVKIIVVVDVASQARRFVGIPVANSFDAIDTEIEAVVITDLIEPKRSLQMALRRFGSDRVLVPRVLRLSTDEIANAK